jgi:cytochrome c-type biogenesis protein CcmH/NrfF
MKNLITTIILILITLPLFGDELSNLEKKLTDDQRKQAVYFEKNIMAVCCFGGPVHSHGQNQYTEAAKIDIRKMILAGRTESQILDYFRNQIDPRTGQPYGNRILAAPKSDEMVGQVSYWMVVAFSIVGLALLWIMIKRLRKPNSNSTPKATNIPIDSRVEDELKALED